MFRIGAMIMMPSSDILCIHFPSGFCTFSIIRLKESSLPIFFLLVFLLGTIGTASVFRSSELVASLCSRYRIIAVSALACTVYLALGEIPLKRTVFLQWVLPLFMFCAVFANLFFLLVGWRPFVARNEIYRKNLLTWPATNAGIQHIEERKELSSRILRTCVDKKIYDPRWLLKPGEDVPKAPLPWPQPPKMPWQQ